MSESLFSIAPSGMTHLAEMREFAARMHPDIGPMFGRDVTRMTVVLETYRDAMERAVEELASGFGSRTAAVLTLRSALNGGGE